MTTEIESLASFRELIASDKVVVINFYAPWAAPSTTLLPVYESLASTYPKFSFCKVNVDAQQDIANEIGVTDLPTIQLYKGGVKIGSSIGATEALLKDLLHRHGGESLGSTSAQSSPSHLIHGETKNIESLASFNQLIASDQVVVINFFAPWAAPSTALSPVYESLATSNPKLSFYKVNIDAQQDIANEIGVTDLPTIQLYKGGVKIGSSIGATEETLKELLQRHASK